MLRKIKAPLERRGVQLLFAFITVLIGIQFIRFVNSYLDPGSVAMISRPAGVEGFLPISALVALTAWLVTGVFDQIHPAGLVLFLLIMGISLVLKRSFCSWVCPIGTLSEGLALLGKKIFGRNFSLPLWLDYILRSLKYVLLGFFVFFIFIGMSGAAAYAFLQTPYNMIADVKMLDFFKNMSAVGVSVIAILVLFSLLVENFWCRYLCPYGALLGLLSIFSPFKISRNTETCISCERCTAVCPNRLKVAKKKTIWSPECTGCLNCVKSCPVDKTLELKSTSLILTPQRAALSILIVWFSVVAIAKLTGNWETSIPPEMYKVLIPMAGQF
ncbi:MAG: 4Fe-4S binding protein [Desulfitobacterium sp.]|nr:4Fe-4S binding protein [Desulfitobacterium sp.]